MLRKDTHPWLKESPAMASFKRRKAISSSLLSCLSFVSPSDLSNVEALDAKSARGELLKRLQDASNRWEFGVGWELLEEAVTQLDLLGAWIIGLKLWGKCFRIFRFLFSSSSWRVMEWVSVTTKADRCLLAGKVRMIQGSRRASSCFSSSMVRFPLVHETICGKGIELFGECLGRRAKKRTGSFFSRQR